MSKEKKASYIIIRTGVTLGLGDKAIEHTIGDEVKLTDDQATSLIGKVSSKKDYNGETNTVDKLTKENKKLTKENEGLKEQLEKLTEQLTGAGDDSSSDDGAGD